MITKIKTIKNLAVFKDFNWDTEVVDSEKNILNFKKINIIYGRNYSGKTTISRILKAMETGSISDKYENPECCVCVKDNGEVTQNDFTAHDKTIRVFNDDFIKLNLKFIINQDENIQPFAILGGDNNKIEEAIRLLKEKLGSDTEDEETALYKDLKTLEEHYKVSKNAHSGAVKSLDRQIRSKAIDNPNGIKYHFEKFGDQNYTTRKLQNEIGKVLKDSYTVITDNEQKQAEDILLEQVKPTVKELPALLLKFEEYIQIADKLLTRKIGRSDKIEELVKNAVLNRWVKEGRKLHKEQRTICAFCNNHITDERWQVLDRHFDEESDKLEKEIINLLSNIKQEKERVTKTTGFKKDDFYKEFHPEVERLNEEYLGIIGNYKTSLEKIEKQLNVRKDDILNEKVFEQPEDYSEKIEEARTKFEDLRTKSNEYTASLGSKQTKAKETLRLKEVYDFAQDINYKDLKRNILNLQTKETLAKEKRDNKQRQIGEILSKIASKQKELKDESKGADKVNEYLNDFFGHNFLTLKAIEFEDTETGDKKYRFEIQRNNKKAHHLSEGECSLIAFCYFMAKLQDIDTKSKKPIIWIDDPISSLDSNHIFFIYTLINTKIFGEDDFEQLFISTHNLEFLKFLKRLPNANNDENRKESKKKYRYLIVERIDNNSTKVSQLRDMLILRQIS